jgi:hypothetical protein
VGERGFAGRGACGEEESPLGAESSGGGATAGTHTRLRPSERGLGTQAAAQGAISAEQVKRLWTIARRELELGDEAVKAVVVAVTGQESTKAIPTAHYDKVLEELRLAAAAAKT